MQCPDVFGDLRPPRLSLTHIHCEPGDLRKPASVEPPLPAVALR